MTTIKPGTEQGPYKVENSIDENETDCSRSGNGIFDKEFRVFH